MSESRVASDQDRGREKNFAIIGVGGYIAPRHLNAIRASGHRIVAALDKHDSVGILDSYFPDAEFFTEFERFDRHVEKLRRMGEDRRVHYLTICSPNYLHDAHIRYALRINANPICEKPLVINPWNVDALEELEQECGRKINCILQLRLHPALIALKEQIRDEPASARHLIDLTYITSRGRWYFSSWKGDPEKSGGVATNIGIHFFDMLMWIFGDVLYYELHHSDPTRMAGFVKLNKADVRWFLSINRNDLPAQAAGKSTYRSITVDGREIEFSEKFADLHTLVYQDILAGRGFGIKEVRPSINLVHALRYSAAHDAENGHRHPLLSAPALAAAS
ncbi:MAG: Gfo/Idh/MocA family oxidoreductase [Acidobacteria bacterium]|nr:Gfo/Idh/MocA family oxidoreductase [Acidobacteriota bacterium]